MQERTKEQGAESSARNGQPGDVGRKAGARCHLTDLGNAQRLVMRHGADLRYCFPWGKWLCWDGKRWASDLTGEVERRAKETVRHIYSEASKAEGDETRAALAKHAAKSEGTGRIRAMIDLARSELPIPVVPGDLDKDNWALNCQNGTLDLRTGELRPHDRTDNITKLCPVDYDPDAQCPLFESFVNDIFLGNVAVIGYIRRFLGYCLTGETCEQILPIFWGGGCNGKSTLLTTFLRLLGQDYAIKGATDLLMVKRGEAHPTEKADLFGKRFVACMETEEGRKLAESLVKDLTGEDQIRARRMREDFWEFAPTHKLVMCSNHKPVISGTDHAIWRRIHLVPFQFTVPPDKKDPDLPKKLLAELAGILAWCVQGCMEWQRCGLQPPKEVQDATAEYREDQDVFGAFLGECCLQGSENFRVKAADIWEAYCLWCETNNVTKLNRNNFGQALVGKGFERYTDNGAKYKGVALTSEWIERVESRNPHASRNGFRR